MATMKIDLCVDSTSAKAMQQKIKQKLIYMKVTTADGLADLGTKCYRNPEFTRLVGLNMMGNASVGRTLPEQQFPNDDRRNMVYSMANDSRDQKIARD
eukprot:2464321-Heterocapsa_arctica.AAC.1